MENCKIGLCYFVFYFLFFILLFSIFYFLFSIFYFLFSIFYILVSILDFSFSFLSPQFIILKNKKKTKKNRPLPWYLARVSSEQHFIVVDIKIEESEGQYGVGEGERRGSVIVQAMRASGHVIDRHVRLVEEEVDVVVRGVGGREDDAWN